VGANSAALQHRGALRENVAAIVLFYTPSAKTTKAIIEEYVGGLSQDDLKQLIARLKERKFFPPVFSLGFPFGIELFSN